jgi:hypothetical protein
MASMAVTVPMDDLVYQVILENTVREVLLDLQVFQDHLVMLAKVELIPRVSKESAVNMGSMVNQ